MSNRINYTYLGKSNHKLYQKANQTYQKCYIPWQECVTYTTEVKRSRAKLQKNHAYMHLMNGKNAAETTRNHCKLKF